MKWDKLQKDHYYLMRGLQSVVIFHFNGAIEDVSGYSGPSKRIGCYSFIHVGSRVKAYVRDTYVMAFLGKEFKEIAEDDYLKLIKLRKMFESVVFPLIKHLVKN